jgi:hypothetical protein
MAFSTTGHLSSNTISLAVDRQRDIHPAADARVRARLPTADNEAVLRSSLAKLAALVEAGQNVRDPARDPGLAVRIR